MERALKFLNDEAVLDVDAGEISYGNKYFQNYKNRNYTEMGYKLNTLRRSYVECFSNDGEILDYGTGFGDIVMKDLSGRWFGYDINPKTKKRLGNRFDDQWEHYANICFFDVLEHLHYLESLLNTIKQGVKLFIRIPLWNGNWIKI